MPACLYVRATVTLQHVSLLTLEGMRIPFLVVPTAENMASATPAQCQDGARETFQIRQLWLVPYVWVVDTEFDEWEGDRYPILKVTSM